MVWIEGAKRLALPYVAVAAGTAGPALVSRLDDTAASALATDADQLPLVHSHLRQMAHPLTAIVVERTDCAADGAANGAADGAVLEDGGRNQTLRDVMGGLPCHNAHQLLHGARLALGDASAHFRVAGGETSRVLGASAWVGGLWQLVAPRPVEASDALFILYTSGSTGKPKGIVHTHGGYQVGLVATTEVIFARRPEDVLMVIATPGWITGQSYMIAAALLCRIPSVLLDGSPVAPPDRFAAVMARHRVSILKAGSTFLRMLMTQAEGAALFGMHDLSALRLGTFCAEPVNEAVHRFAMAHLTPYYINSYWATEHGGIVWSRTLSAREPLQPDATSWPLPWIAGDVVVRTGEGSTSASWRRARDGEPGEVAIGQQFPYMALTVWRSEGFGTDRWRGDIRRWASYFAEGAGYVQGDTAVRHASGAYSFRGRSDEVINVGGNRIGTEEIENALLLDRELPGSPVGNCVVVGMPDEVIRG